MLPFIARLTDWLTQLSRLAADVPTLCAVVAAVLSPLNGQDHVAGDVMTTAVGACAPVSCWLGLAHADSCLVEAGRNIAGQWHKRLHAALLRRRTVL
jgi:hypothetical protein